MNDVYREGDTVVRNGGPWTPTVHRYLEYLRLAGIDWIPRPLEIMPDTRGGPERERLSYVRGDVPPYPLPDWMFLDEVLVDGAQRLRRLHDASIGFASDGAVWQSPSKIPAEVICHNDFAPHNLVFHAGRIVGAIDFDFCSPGPRLWDIAYFATRAVPLGAGPPANAPGADQVRRRVQLILDAYDAPSTSFDDVLRVASSGSTILPTCPARRPTSSASRTCARTPTPTTGTVTTLRRCVGDGDRCRHERTEDGGVRSRQWLRARRIRSVGRARCAQVGSAAG